MAYLKQGDTGEKVKAMQTALNYLKYPCGTADGDWGPKTEASVRAFQTAQNLGISSEDYDILVQMGTPSKPKSEHFSWEEVNVHDPALQSIWKDLPPELYANAQDLMDNFLEPLRAELNRLYGHLGEVRLVVRSWYRPEPYNTKVGGTKGSLHTQGIAADVYAVIGGNVRLPNCYQIARAREAMNLRGGRGCGSNTNYHIDSGNTRIWFYTYTSWSIWEDHQGAKA